MPGLLPKEVFAVTGPVTVPFLLWLHLACPDGTRSDVRPSFLWLSYSRYSHRHDQVSAPACLQPCALFPHLSCSPAPSLYHTKFSETFPGGKVPPLMPGRYQLISACGCPWAAQLRSLRVRCELSRCGKVGSCLPSTLQLLSHAPREMNGDKDGVK